MPAVIESQERPNIFSAGWSRGVESVPSYEAAPSDPRAIAYRVARGAKVDTYELHGESPHERFDIGLPDDAKSHKTAENSIEVTRRVTEGASSEAIAIISSINRKKINLLQKEPNIKLSSSHGKVPLLIYRGGYCGFRHPASNIDYYWQLRYYPKKTGEKSSKAAVFKDAVFRKTVDGQLSTMAGIYVPSQPASASPNLSSMTSATRREDDDTIQNDLGRFLLRSDLDRFDRDMALISFVAVLIRILEVNVSSPQILLGPILILSSRRTNLLTASSKR